MLIPIRYASHSSLLLAALLLAGCESHPVAGPLPVRVAPSAAAPAATPVSLAPADAGSAGTPFSLPIGGKIPAPATPVPPVPVSAPSGLGPINGGPAVTVPQQSQSPPATPTGSPAAGQRKVHLSAGIALPQLLPDGTAIGISVDYAVASEVNRSSRYIWVVKSAAGEIASEVRLEPTGTLSAFFPQLKPEHRPFSVRIEELTSGSQHRTLISNELPLKTDY